MQFVMLSVISGLGTYVCFWDISCHTWFGIGLHSVFALLFCIMDI